MFLLDIRVLRPYNIASWFCPFLIINYDICISCEVLAGLVGTGVVIQGRQKISDSFCCVCLYYHANLILFPIPQPSFLNFWIKYIEEHDEQYVSLVFLIRICEAYAICIHVHMINEKYPVIIRS